MITLFSRRPTVAYVANRLTAMSSMVDLLDAASTKKFGQICRASWVYLDTVRQAEINQSIADQRRLAGIEAAMRNLMTQCLRYYANAGGSRSLTLTQDASDAISQMLAYDVTTAATFDIENTVLRILRGAKIT